MPLMIDLGRIRPSGTISNWIVIVFDLDRANVVQSMRMRFIMRNIRYFPNFVHDLPFRIQISQYQVLPSIKRRRRLLGE